MAADDACPFTVGKPVMQQRWECLTAAGLPAPRGEPLAHYSPGVQVRIGLPASYRCEGRSLRQTA